MAIEGYSNGNGNRKNDDGFSSIYNFVTATLVALVVLLFPFVYSLNQSVARLQSEHENFVSEQAIHHEELEYTRRQLGQTVERMAALEQAMGMRIRPLAGDK